MQSTKWLAINSANPHKCWLMCFLKKELNWSLNWVREHPVPQSDSFYSLPKCSARTIPLSITCFFHSTSAVAVFCCFTTDPLWSLHPAQYSLEFWIDPWQDMGQMSQKHVWKSFLRHLKHVYLLVVWGRGRRPWQVTRSEKWSPAAKAIFGKRVECFPNCTWFSRSQV